MSNISKIKEWGIVGSYETGNELYCYCPFHADKKASLCVNLRKPVWFCHSCERGGTLDKLGRLLAKEGIIEHVEEEPKKKYPLAKMEIEDFEELKLAVNCQYLFKRGFDNNTIRSWEIRRSTIFAVLPLKDKNNNVEGLILRSMIKDYEPRYQAKHFKKKDHLFGKKTSEYPYDKMVVLVEGPLDAVKVWQNMNKNDLLKDFAGVYAVMGSSMSERQIKLLSQISNRIFIFMDNEESGRVATRKIAKNLLGFDLYVPDINLYKSKDPGDMEENEFSCIYFNLVSYLKARMNNWFGTVM